MTKKSKKRKRRKAETPPTGASKYGRKHAEQRRGIFRPESPFVAASGFQARRCPKCGRMTPNEIAECTVCGTEID